MTTGSAASRGRGASKFTSSGFLGRCGCIQAPQGFYWALPLAAPGVGVCSVKSAQLLSVSAPSLVRPTLLAAGAGAPAAGPPRPRPRPKPPRATGEGTLQPLPGDRP